ncbi:MAG: putative dehydrogenase like protein [Firmicutes bacterium]|nr:putative dehydrogenase like protein [Bacillota bacterium]
MGSMFDLNGKVALITGGDSGLGQAMTLALAEAGANVVVAYNSNLAKAEETSQQAEKLGVKALPLQVNVADEESVANMLAKSVAGLGEIDILVNSAGINRRGPCVDLAVEDFEATLNVNLKGTFLCCRAVGPAMIARGSGKVINIASLLGTVALENRIPYASSKGAVIQLTKVLAVEWAKYHINVNAIGPGYFATDLNRKLMDDPVVYNDLKSRIPMGYWADPSELGGSVVFLASKASDYVTGHVLWVDGGYLCW